MTSALDRIRRIAPRAVGASLAGSAVIHLVRPAVFGPMVPPWLTGRGEAWVRGSGVVEGVAGIGLLTAQRWAGPFAAAVLAGIWPGNLQMALDAGTGRHPGLLDNRIVAWGRLPLQIPLIWAALQSSEPPRNRRDRRRDNRLGAPV